METSQQLTRQASHEPDEPGSTTGRYHIGAVASMTDLSHQTLRHWEDAGLVRPSRLNQGGFRLYSDADVQRLLVVRRMKPLQFSLEEMRQLLASLTVVERPDASADERADAVAYLRQCHERAELSIARQRKHLAYAEELTAVLADELRKAEALSTDS